MSSKSRVSTVGVIEGEKLKFWASSTKIGLPQFILQNIYRMVTRKLTNYPFTRTNEFFKKYNALNHAINRLRSRIKNGFPNSTDTKSFVVKTQPNPHEKRVWTNEHVRRKNFTLKDVTARTGIILEEKGILKEGMIKQLKNLNICMGTKVDLWATSRFSRFFTK